MTGKAIVPEHHLVRYVPWSKLRKVILEDGSEVVEGPSFEAFALKPDEEFLSANWREFFEGTPAEQIHLTVQLFRRVRKSVGSKSAFAVGNVGDIKSVCASRRHQIRVVHEVDGDNISHVAVRRYPPDDIEMLERLAASAWSALTFNSEVPA